MSTPAGWGDPPGESDIPAGWSTDGRRLEAVGVLRVHGFGVCIEPLGARGHFSELVHFYQPFGDDIDLPRLDGVRVRLVIEPLDAPALLDRPPRR